MPTWKKSETIYTVKLAHHDTRGSQIYLPKPIVEKLGKPDTVSFLLTDESVLLMPSNKAYAKKALELLEDFMEGTITREEAGPTFIDMATEPIIEEHEVLNDIFSELILIDEPEGKGQLTLKEIGDLKQRLRSYLETSDSQVFRTTEGATISTVRGTNIRKRLAANEKGTRPRTKIHTT